MAEPTAVNSQITDAVTQTNVEVLGQAPAQALGTVYLTLAQAMGLTIDNAVARQQQWYGTAAAAVVQGVDLLFSLGSGAAAAAAREVRSDAGFAESLARLAAATAVVQQLPGPPVPRA